MAVDIGPKIGIQGEKEFRQEISNVNQSLKTLAAEQKAVTSSFDAETDAEKKAAAQKEVLTRQIEAQKDKLALLEKGLRESAQMYGEADTKTLKWQQAVHEATAQLNNMEKQLGDVDKDVDETASSMDDASEATAGWADVMKGQLLADAIKAGFSKLVDWAKSAASAMWDASNAGAAYADDILTLATTTGLSTDELQEYRYMADLVDVSLETVTGSLTKLTSNMAKAAEGEGDAADAFRALGVSVTDSNGNLRKSKDVFKDAINALGKIKNETERDAKAMTLLGKSAKDLNPMIAAGADGMEKLAKEAHETGYVLSGSSLKALGKQQDAMDRLSKKAEALKNNFASKMAPGMAKAYEKMGDAMDNPRVKRSLDVVAEGIGNIIGKAADLASKVLPDLVAAFSGDTRLRTFSDAELLLAQHADDAAESYRNMIDTYNAKADDVNNERLRVEGLWKELQNLTTETGFVTGKNKERADYILHELKEALGVEYDLNGNIIEQYQTMKTEVEGLIKQRTAQQLLEAGQDAYAEAIAEQNSALETAAGLYEALQKATTEAEDAQAAYDARIAEGKEKDVEDLFKYAAAQRTALDAAKKKAAALEEDYNTAREAASGYFDTVDRYEKAQQAVMEGNYEEAIHLMTDDWSANLDYYKKKKDLSDKEKADLREAIRVKKSAIEEYKRGMERGEKQFTEAGLKQLEDFVTEAEGILDGEKVGWHWLSGLATGLSAQQLIDKVKEAAGIAPKEIKRVTTRTLEIKSPSRVGKWIGEMWDEGLIEGLEAKEKQLAQASASLAKTIRNEGTPAGTSYGYGYGNALTAASGVYGGSTSSYTTNLGGITVRVDGAGAVNEDILARRVATYLTSELQRAQRGGRV